jgi:uncharacterized membrane protein YkoI
MQDQHQDDHERVRTAVSRGWALPLSQIAPTVQRAVPGQILDVTLEQTARDGWVYGFVVLTREGGYRDIVVDARRNEILEIRRR